MEDIPAGGHIRRYTKSQREVGYMNIRKIGSICALVACAGLFASCASKEPEVYALTSKLEIGMDRKQVQKVLDETYFYVDESVSVWTVWETGDEEERMKLGTPYVSINFGKDGFVSDFSSGAM